MTILLSIVSILVVAYFSIKKMHQAGLFWSKEHRAIFRELMGLNWVLDTRFIGAHSQDKRFYIHIPYVEEDDHQIRLDNRIIYTFDRDSHNPVSKILNAMIKERDKELKKEKQKEEKRKQEKARLRVKKMFKEFSVSRTIQNSDNIIPLARKN